MNTPTGDDDEQDLSQVKSALFSITDALNYKENGRETLIVFRSTMLPGTMKEVVVDYIDKHCRLQRGKNYNICYNPEFLRHDTAYEDFLFPTELLLEKSL